MIYLDHAAATPLDQAALKKMLPYFSKKFGNPSSIYKFGQEARAAVEDSRGIIAKLLNCNSKEIIFTGSGTEANNWAIFGLAEGNNRKGKHLITTATEHHSVLYPFEQLEKKGYEVTWLKVDKHGLVSIQDLKKAIRPDTIFASVCYANNEIGTIQNMAEIGRLLRSKNIIFHTDACQAAGHLSLNVKELNLDAMTINGGKIYGPKGVGALYINSKIKIVPLLFGGGQEFRMRAGTENVAAVVGFAEALKIAHDKQKTEAARLILLRDFAIKNLLKIPGVFLNGHPTQRLPNNINVSIKGVDGESLLLRLDMAGIAASSGSACTSGSLDPSHVLQALGLSKELTKNSLRLTLGRENNKTELIRAVKIIKKLILKLRQP